MPDPTPLTDFYCPTCAKSVADPLVCGCLYVGTQAAYNQYKLHEQQQRLADEQQMTAQDYSDAAWRWDAWGPWGPVGPAGFVYGTEIGW